MKLPDAFRKLYLNDRWLQFILLAFMVLFYGIILSNARLHQPTWPMNRTFNSMIDHLVHGQFDVDPNTIGGEGNLRNGHVYAYFGITCALVRLPLLLFHRLDLDVTRWSCLIAVCLAGMMKVKTILFLRRNCAPTRASEWAFGLMLACIVLGGAEVAYLRSSIYQEVLFWAVGFAAVFVYFAVKGLVSGEFTVGMISWMAFAAGFATLTRVSTGMGLCAALGLLLLVLLVEELRAGRAVLTRRFFLPVAILAVFLFVTGTVNYNRWGNATTFVNFSGYISNRTYTDFVHIENVYGLFNLGRIPFGLSYFFLPIWVMHGADGRLLFENTQTRLMNNVELPPSSLFLTDLLPMVFIAFLGTALWARRSSYLRSLKESGIIARNAESPSSSMFNFCTRGLAIAAGMAVPCLLMLTAIGMCYRYSMEFYPEIDFLAFLGLFMIVSNPSLLARFNRYRRWMLAATVVSIVSSFTALILYRVSEFDPAQNILHEGVVHYYLQRIWYFQTLVGAAHITRFLH